MNLQSHDIRANIAEPALEEVVRGKEIFCKISDVQEMQSFLMTIVSDSNHWLFIASNGGLTAGRKNADLALFPYYTDDKLIDSPENTGSKTIICITAFGFNQIWEPFSARSENNFKLQRNLYKNRLGNKVVFEEINLDLGLSFQYEWNVSNLYGFVRNASLTNIGEKQVAIRMVDGLQNILPFGVEADLQHKTSNLADAYKRSELLTESRLGIYALSAIIVDKAEPSEALKANAVWSFGLQNATILLSAKQLNNFRRGLAVKTETDMKGERGAYFLHSEFVLEPNGINEWMLVANVNQSQADVVYLDEIIRSNTAIKAAVMQDVSRGSANLLAMVSAADGFQSTADLKADTRHSSNVLYNIMRGGIFDNGYVVEKWDFIAYYRKASKQGFAKYAQLLDDMPESFSVFALKEAAKLTGDADFIRLATEYLPLKFSRRHGDPSRPWNKFTINTISEITGAKVLDYEGNWRDIFQNWEALAFSYPAYMESMIFKFLNASTFDGYNPYRVTKDGFDWETIEPDNPWSYIGYWGDHQIIYLQKFLEFVQNYYPDLLPALLKSEVFVYANVPYKIKGYDQVLQNPKDTIEFNHAAEAVIKERMNVMGANGALLLNQNNQVHTVSLVEKLLATALAKLCNLAPGGGIWMNTQRPEWNDANNALVGNGLSVVTTCYLRRFLHFVKKYFSNESADFPVSMELADYLTATNVIYQSHKSYFDKPINEWPSKQLLDNLGQAADNYRQTVYNFSFSGDKQTVTSGQVLELLNYAIIITEATIQNNLRSDNLYHTYNLLEMNSNAIHFSHLYEMLEGQVGALSSGQLTSNEALELLDGLAASHLYRKDQDSYILYPNKQLPGFLVKNTVAKVDVMGIPLLAMLHSQTNHSIIVEDVKGQFHFNGNFRNADDLKAGLHQLSEQYLPLVQQDMPQVLALYERVFNHKAFTGRSGTFFAYEGLGSIYWHMVSKLLLAVQEVCLHALNNNTDEGVIANLVEHYYAIKAGIGVHKTPAQYGAFSTDAYSHTPWEKGVKQPGMTGQVKEDIISRIGELGIVMTEGKLCFKPVILRKSEFKSSAETIHYIAIDGAERSLDLPEKSLVFTYCQVPIIYTLASTTGLVLKYFNGDEEKYSEDLLLPEVTESIINRKGAIQSIQLFIPSAKLKF